MTLNIKVNMNYLEGPGTEPGAQLASCLPLSPIDFRSGLCGGEGARCWSPLVEERALAVAARSCQASAPCPSPPRVLGWRAHSAMQAGATLPVYPAIPSQAVVSWKGILTPEAKELTA